MQNSKTFRPDQIGSYFRMEWLSLAFVTASGLIYNVGLLATPWFEGRLAQCLADILGGNETAAQMAVLVLVYIAVTLLVQAARFIKRFYVRRFANNINRRMKGVLYANLVRQSRVALEYGGFAATRGCTPCAASRLSLHTHKNSTPAFGVCTIFAGFIILSGR